MKRNALLGIVMVSMWSGAAWAEDPVYFADAKLKALVEAKLGISDPTPSHMLGLTWLSVNREGVTDLTGIEYATNLTYIYLEGNEISDISPLAGLTKLTSLPLGHNRISDISPLASLTNLTGLSLHHNKYISDISPLSGLTNLTSLSLTDNRISNISALSGLTKLTKLGLSSNPIGNISALSSLTNLMDLYLSSAQISNISVLSGLTDLRLLSLSNNQISDISVLAGLTKMDLLYLNNNQISNISALSGLTLLVVLDLGRNEIHDISALPRSTKFMSLDLIYNPLNNEAYCTHLPQVLADNPSLTPYDDLYYSANTTPPFNVNASNGTYSDKVLIEWGAVCSVVGDTCYTVYRAESEDGARIPLTGWEIGTSFEDTTAESDVAYYYWVRAKTSNGGGVYGYSDYSLSDTGWRGSGVTTYALNTSSTAGGSVTVPGEGAYAYTLGTSASIVATAQTDYEFSGWTGTAVDAGKVANSSATSTTVTMDGDYTLVANFSPTTATTHTLGISSGAGGSVASPGEGSYAYTSGTSVSIVAAAETGYEFSGWTGTAVSSGHVANSSAASTTVTVDGDYTLVANFTAVAASSYTLSVSSGEGGSVTMPGVGVFACAPSAVVSVQAVANSGYAFSGWTGSAVSAGKVAHASAASTTVTVDADYTLTANFQGADHTLKVSATAGGWVTTPGEGSFSYSHSQSVTLEAQAQPGYHFVEWSGSLCSSSNPVSLEMNSDHTVTANFAVNPPTLTVSSGQGGSVVVPGEGAFVYACGVEVRGVAIPDPGYVFVGWTGTLVEMGGLADHSAGRVDFAVEMDATLCANFAPAVLCLYVDDNASGDPSAYNPLFSDPAEDGTWEHPFDSVREAIDAADAGDAVLVLPGTYREHISFRGKDIMVSAFDLCSVGTVSQTVLAGTDANSVVVFEEGESAGSILAGFTILGGAGELGGGIRCCGADPIIANCLIAGNRADQGSGVYCQGSRATLANCTIADNFSWLEGGGLHCDGDVTVINSILYGNRPEQIVADPCQAPCVTYSAVRGGCPGEGNLDCDPRFVEQGHWSLPADLNVSVAPDDPQATWVGGNYHLKAEEGHWNGWGWLCDGSTSPCVDAGSPNADVKCEPLPNGNRINMGAFGGTAEASQSPSDATQQ